MSLFGDPEEFDYPWAYDWPRELLGCTLVQTCAACPEQYDVFLEDQQIGYLRLRHGHFRADYPDCGGTVVYESDTDGDGAFEDRERMPMLNRAVAALLVHHNSVDT